MSYTKSLLISLAIICTLGHFTIIYGATFDIVNKCAYPVWVAASPGRGRRLDQGQTWQITTPPGNVLDRISGRTNCTFDANGRGQCETGDCNGLLKCVGWGAPPHTLAQYRLGQPGENDVFDISLVEGFNIPMDFSPIGGACRGIRCDDTSIISQCPKELRRPGGCNNPCQMFNTDEYCCTPEPGSCGPTDYSRFFKERCPDAFSYPQDDETSTFTCPSGTNYRVVFCP